MPATKPLPRIGERCYEVEWCTKVFFDTELDCCDPDKDEVTFRHFSTLEKAKSYAESVYPETINNRGVVVVTEMVFVPYDEDDAASMPHVGFWEAASDSMHFSGEWEN